MNPAEYADRGPLNARARELFREDYGRVLVRTDRLFAGLLIFQWVAGIAAAYWISPRTWIGEMSSVHVHVWAAVFLGAIIAIVPAILAGFMPGRTITRHCIAAGQMMSSALLIHLLGGRIETHFHIFGSLAFLSFYRDWKVLLTATIVTVADHFARGVFAPQSIFGVSVLSQWRWLEHAGWVVFEDAFLVLACLQGQREMVSIARRQAEIESQNELLADAVERANSAAQAKSQFLANMSHEIRTPLNGVVGMLDLLLGSTLPEKERDFANLARLSARGLAIIVNDILDFSKIEAGKLDIVRTEFDLRSNLHELMEGLRPAAEEKGLALNVVIDEDVPCIVNGDADRIRQVLVNLVGNAVKFTAAGFVDVRVSCVFGRAGSLRVRFSVKDTGIGVPKDRLNRLFKAFSQADVSNTRMFGGTGLGLAISKQLTELMGGSIGVESDEGKGSTFFIVLPLESRTTPKVMTSDPVRSVAEAGGMSDTEREGAMHLLLAEDNEINQIVATEILKAAGYVCVIAPNGVRAIEEARKERFDLVLMDCQMPEMDGFDATREIRKLEAIGEVRARTGDRLPIIALTANAMKGDKERCLDAGMDGYETKPVESARLLKTIHDTLMNLRTDPGGKTHHQRSAA